MGMSKEYEKKFTEDITIKKVEYGTGLKGNIFLIGHLNTTRQLKNENINAIIFHDLNQRRIFAKGAKFKMDFDENNCPHLRKVLRLPKPQAVLDVPRFCPKCGCELGPGGSISGTDAYELICLNRECPATSRGFLYRFFRQVQDHRVSNLLFFEKFLDKFAYNGDNVRVDNFYEFKIVFDHLKEKNTESRKKSWETIYPGEGDKFWDFELKIQNYLNSAQHYCNEFWDICNFPGIDYQDKIKLRNVSPADVFTYKPSKNFKKLPSSCKKYIYVNKDFITFLYDFFNAYGEKEWMREY